MEDAKESSNTFGESIDDLREQSRDFVLTCLTSQRNNMRELLDSQRKKLTERNDALEAMMMALKEETMASTRALSTRIEELEGKLALYRAAMGNRVSSVALSNEDVPKPKEFVGTRSVCDVDNFLWRMEYYFRAKGIVDDALSEAMMVVESMVKLGLGKDKLGSSKSEERGVCEMDHKEDIIDGNGNGDNNGNGKPRAGKKKPKRKRDKLKCFLCDGPHMLKKCPRKSALEEKPVGKALVTWFERKGCRSQGGRKREEASGVLLVSWFA
ncbi:hypothetical protein Gotur_028462 [Gossypium turneri]